MSSVLFSDAGVKHRPASNDVAMYTTALLAVVMLIGALLVPVNTQSFVSTTSEGLSAAARSLVDTSSVSAEEQAVLDQLEAVGNGLTFEETVGSLDARFMLAGPVFGTDVAPFSITTAQYQGEAVAAVAPVADGDQIVYQRGEVTEWWRQAGSSYEQGWTVASAPTNGETTLSLLVGFANAAPLAESTTTVQLILSDGTIAWYRDLHAFDADGTILPATMTVDGSNVRIEVDAAGAAYPVTIDPIVDADQKLVPPASTTGDVFGEAVATDGDLMIVSVRGADGQVADAGRADIYKWDGALWVFQDSLENPIADDTDFAWSVDINATAGHAVVGAPREDTNGVDAGAVHIYVDNGDSTWTRTQTIYECTVVDGPCGSLAAGGFDGSQFGKAVAISDTNRIAVGAPGAQAGEGRTFVYDQLPGVGDAWATTVSRELAAGSPLNAGDRFGAAVDISADGLFIVSGIPGNPTGAGADNGTVGLSGESVPGQWVSLDGDNGPSSNAGQEHGASVAIGVSTAGDHIVVAGRPYTTREDLTDTGFGGVRVYRIQGAVGAETLVTVGLGDVSAPTDDGHGFDVAFDSATDRVIVGAPFNNGGVGEAERGLVRVYQYDAANNRMDPGPLGGASAAALPLPSDWFGLATGLDTFGFSVAAAPAGSGKYVAGSPGEVSTTPRRSPKSGRVTTTGPSVASDQTVAGTKTAAAYDQLGWAVAVSGNRMAASAIGDDESISQNGLVYTYERETSSDPWALDQLIVDPTETDAAKPFGYSLDMEGNFLAIGSPGGVGEVAVYEFNGTAWTYIDSVTGANELNTAGALEFGYDVAITEDGDHLFVGIPGNEAAGHDEGGGVVNYQRVGNGYISQPITIPGNTNRTRFGQSLDADVVGSTVRVVIGLESVGTDNKVETWTFDLADPPPIFMSPEENFVDAAPIGQSVAIDGDRIAAASLSEATDKLVVFDRNGIDDWSVRELFSGVLFDGTGALPNNQLDVSGGTIAIGRSDGAGGEVGVFYNDPAFGWGLSDISSGWIDGPTDRIQPAGRAFADKIGLSVAIDGAGATKTIIAGAPGDDDSGEDAGAVFSTFFEEGGNAIPANKLTGVDLASPGTFGSAISTRGGAVPAAIVAEADGQRAHYLNLNAGSWNIAQTLQYTSEVIDVDLQADGKAAVLLAGGDVIFYEEVCVVFGAGTVCSLAATGVTGNASATTSGSVSISGTDVVVVKTAGSGDQFQQFFWADGSNAPVGGPGGIVPTDLFGASMVSANGFTFIGAPGFDTGLGTNTGRVYVWNSFNMSYPLTIDGQDAGAKFGSSIAYDGTTLVIGAEDDGGNDGLVHVYDFEFAGAPSATRIATLSPDAGSGLSHWGDSVAVDGSTIVVGASNYQESGAAYRDGTAVAFGFDGTQWVQTDLFDHTDDAAGDAAGTAVGVIGSEVLVGVPFDDNPLGQDAGAVYSYTATAPPSPIPNKVISTSPSGEFGRTLEISGTRAVVVEQAGERVHILEEAAGDWSILQSFDVTGVVAADMEGSRFVTASTNGDVVYYDEICPTPTTCTFSSIGGTTLTANGNPTSILLSGNDVYVGKNSTVAPLVRLVWLSTGTGTERAPAGIFAGEGTGASLAIDGNLLFVGAPRWDNNPEDEAGRVYVFDTATNTFTGTIVAAGPGILFGFSLAADNGRLAVGYALGEGPINGGPGVGITGVVETYTNLTTAGALAVEHVVTADDVGVSDAFGFSVDLDGDTMVVGAAAKSVGGTRTGQAYSFNFAGGSWVQQDTFTATDNDFDDQFGNDVAISGQSVLVGAPFDDNVRGTDGGAVYSFTATLPEDNPTLFFDIGLDPNGPSSVEVAPNGIAVTDFNAELVENAAEDDSSVAASRFGATDISESPISALPISALPISALARDTTSPLHNIPLTEISIGTEGGWPAILAGTPLADEPLVNLTLGDVVTNPAADSNLASTPISALEVQGTPISALPISALLLGTLELGAIAGADWCTILADDLPGFTCAEIEGLTLVEATLVGVPISALPISALPISALPISALDLDALPISALKMSEIDLAESPISALPISALPISALPISALPISALPISALPISALPISALDLNASPISALDLDAAPISALELRNVPISALDVEGAPISALPISALPISALLLQDVNLSDIPIEGDWCEILADFDGYDCTFATDPASFLASTTIRDLGVRGVPISALPISALPISALPISALPISALPISALPISALPISALPISALPISALPISALGVPNLASVPISALDVQGSPISALPISALDLNASSIADLPISALPISALPISALPISALVVNGTTISALPISALDIGGTPIGALPISALPISALGIDCDLVDCDIDSLYDAVLNGAIDPAAVTLGDIAPFLSGVRLSDLAEEIEAATGALPGAVANAAAASTLLLSELGDVDNLTLGDLPLTDPRFGALLFGEFASALWSLRLSDLVGALIDPTTGLPFSDTDVESSLDLLLGALPGTPTLGDVDFAGDMTLADVLSGDTTGFDLGSLGPILALVHITDLLNVTAQSGNIGDLTADELGDITLLDLLGITDFDNLTLGELFDAANANSELLGFDVGDLLLALLGVDAAPFSNLDFTEVESGLLPASVVPPVKFVGEFEVRTSANQQSVEFTAQLPATATYVPGTALAQDEDDRVLGTEPVVSGNTLSWTLHGANPDKIVFVSFDVKPTVSLGSTRVRASARIIGTDVFGSGSASVTVVEGIEPNDFPETTLASEDTVYLTYISSETDIDVFEITVAENDQLAIQLSSLTSDLDFALYGKPLNTNVNAALTNQSNEAPLEPITDPDQEGADTEPLNDFRRLDEEDATLDFVDISNSPGTETELLITAALPAGTYYVQVFGANGATNIEPAAMQLQVLEAEERPACSAQGAVTGATGIAPPLAGSSANTLILVNQQRTEFLYPGEWDDLETEIDELVAYLTDPVNAALGINPIVVPVDGIGSVQAAYSAWDTDSACNPESANAIVQAIIANAVDPLRDTLEHIVVVGGDPVIPMARLLDATEVANEYDYRHAFIGDNGVGGSLNNINAFSASSWDRQYLSDEPYGESAARSLGNRFLYVSDIALGRMVETPDEIQAALQHFQDFDGALQADTAAILGYDFLADSSAEIAADLAAAGVAVDDELADGRTDDPGNPKWNKDDAEDKVIPLAGAPDLISLNGHFDHYRALPADGDQVPGFVDNFLASTVASAPPGVLQGSIVFSMGCHSGLSVADVQINGGLEDINGDWAQTFAADQAIFVGNTGFGYGDTEAVAYTEKLMALFAEQAVRPVQFPGGGPTTTIGQALTFAKNEYARDLSVFSIYDEKALMESTFYGLPFYRVGATPIAADPIPTNNTSPDANGIESLTVTANPDNNLEITPSGSIYSNLDEDGDPQVIVAPGMPVQPSQSFDVSVVDAANTTELGTVARGALVLDMTSEYISPVDPVVSSAVFNESFQRPEPKIGTLVFPAKPVTLNRTTTPSGERQTLVLATGQFNSNGLVQRLDDNIDVVVYYADQADSDFTTPIIGAVESTLVATPLGSELTVSLSATDRGGADAPDVSRVYVLVAANPGVGTVEWEGFDLVRSPGSEEWSGSLLLPAAATRVRFLVQAVDESGNVGFATNKARNFDDDQTPDPEPPAPDLDVMVDQSNLDAPSGWFTGSVSVTVDSGDLDATYLIQPGGVETDVPASGVFVVDNDGVNSVTVTRTDGQTVSNTIRIDTQAPTVVIAPPENGALFFESDVPNVLFQCQDPSLSSCTGTADGSVIESADPLPATVGPHVVTATAIDALGNSATATANYTVQADPPVGDPPTIIESEIDGIAIAGAPVDIFGEFTDGAAPFTISVDWGNGDTCPGDGTCSVDPPEAGMPGVFEASYTYPVGGQFDVTVTITDANGASDTVTMSSATCTITGTAGKDVLWGTSGADVICGLGGNDRINGRAGNDLIHGGAGNDLIRGANGDDVIYGGRGNDLLLGQGQNDTLIGGKGIDLISGGNGSDILKGRGGNDILIGGDGNDTLIGNRGSDKLFGGYGNDDLTGGRGNDYIYGWVGTDTIQGGSGDDVIYGGSGADEISGGADDDFVSGGSGADVINGDDGDDNLLGGYGNDEIDGGDGTDRCRGNSGTDQLTACEI